ncbi:MAG: hypothetical protein IKM43_04270 [Clostridia bacterium]|nr:hypothetical protein [Clostridia bacterium]
MSDTTNKKPRYNLNKVGDWSGFIQLLPFFVYGREVGEYFKNLSVRVEIKKDNTAVIKIIGLNGDQISDMRFYVFDILGCKTIGYFSELSIFWRDYLTETFGRDYQCFVDEYAHEYENEIGLYIE